MSAKRAPMTPPDLPGFTYLDVLGSGGFADVFLYEQHLPRRRVAVKVLLPERMTSGSVAEFTAEANVMAMLSTHPAIVTIHQASVADDGRPYLVMEYCPKPNLQVRYRREPFGVAEALRVGVQVASAVETAHRAGVLHRDIKPANILVTEYNRPALTDFGIASTTTTASESEGMSIPWSPPESFADVPTADPRSDVYALGATVYTLLAGRSPFELPGERNTSVDLIDRIERRALPQLGRPDAPASLQLVLERAMAKGPGARYETALAFGRALQKIQIELAHSVTPIDILDDSPIADDVEEEGEDLTRVRGVVSIDPETAPAAGLTRPGRTPEGPVVDGIPSLAGAAGAALAAADAADTMRRDDLSETLIRPSGRPQASRPVYTAPPAQAPPGPPQPPAPAPQASAPQAPSVRPDPEPSPRFESASGPPAPVAPQKKGRALPWILTGAALVVVAGIVVAVSLPTILDPTPTPAPTDEIVDPENPASIAVPRAEDIQGSAAADGSIVFTWTNPDPQDGDAYFWSAVSLGDANPDVERVETPSVTVPGTGGEVCIEVTIVRDNGRASSPERGCAP